jgi:hypothetical protein
MKKNSWIKRSLAAVLCAGLVTATFPRKAAADLTEYALLLVLISLAAITVAPNVDPKPWGVIGGHLQAAATAAQNANVGGDRSTEIGRLGETIGGATAMMALTSSCDSSCDGARENLQATIGIAAFLKSVAVGTVTASCNPDGIVEAGEQCDPTATPSGCPATTVGTFCDSECLCEQVLGPPSTTP